MQSPTLPAPGRGADRSTGRGPDRGTDRRTTVHRVVAAVLAVVAVLVLADLGTAAAAESGISRQMRDRLGLPEDPAVQVQGISFLAQAVTGRYDRIDVSMQRVPIGPLQTPEVEVQMHGVRAPLSDLIGSGPSRFRAAAAEGIVRIGPMDVRRLVVAAGGPAAGVERLTAEEVEANDIDTVIREGADPTLRGLDPRNAARFVAEMPVDGEDAKVAVLSALVVSDGKLRIVPRDVREYETHEPVPAAVRDSLMSAMAVEVDPGRLPLGVTPTSVSVPEFNVLEISGAVRDLGVGSDRTSD
ncbi:MULTISPECIES: DUF2993 domain-containing protein [unclassified Pseudonocardia]|uniref:LmeA family phospholipid-binding protein n=1 Tax=unclassified Pseudonocardia TaxID=2619320 RepID=UPI0001FFEBF7|nr:DUF2993 domain-containing protein [Pseudonocardia sp. Ae707_Ps1]OLM16130.1 hypothetical protein Ae707Ps1_0388c [Pseudonocardia sp. Ae707_Ps1]